MSGERRKYKTVKWLLGIGLALAVLLAGVVVVLAVAIDRETLRREAERLLARSLGKDVALQEVSLRVFPRPGVRLGPGSMGQAGAPYGDMFLSWESLEVSPALLPMFRGRLALAQVKAQGMRLQLPEGGDAATSEPGRVVIPEVGSLELEDARLFFSGRSLSISRLSAGPIAPGGTAQLDMDMETREAGFILKGSVQGELYLQPNLEGITAGPLRLKAHVESGQTRLVMESEARLEAAVGKGGLEFQLAGLRLGGWRGKAWGRFDADRGEAGINMYMGDHGLRAILALDGQGQGRLFFHADIMEMDPILALLNQMGGNGRDNGTGVGGGNLPLPPPGCWTAQGRVSMLSIGGNRLENVLWNVSLQDRAVWLGPLRANAAGGGITADGAYLLENDHGKASLNIQARDVDLAALVLPIPGLSGKAFVQVGLNASGASLAEFSEQMDGRITLVLSDGIITGFSLRPGLGEQPYKLISLDLALQSGR